MVSRLRSAIALCSCLFVFSCGVLAAEEPPEEPAPKYCRIKEKYGEIFVHPENLFEWADVLTTDTHEVAPAVLGCLHSDRFELRYDDNWLTWRLMRSSMRSGSEFWAWKDIFRFSVSSAIAEKILPEFFDDGCMPSSKSYSYSRSGSIYRGDRVDFISRNEVVLEDRGEKGRFLRCDLSIRDEFGVCGEVSVLTKIDGPGAAPKLKVRPTRGRAEGEAKRKLLKAYMRRLKKTNTDKIVRVRELDFDLHFKITVLRTPHEKPVPKNPPPPPQADAAEEEEIVIIRKIKKRNGIVVSVKEEEVKNVEDSELIPREFSRKKRGRLTTFGETDETPPKTKDDVPEIEDADSAEAEDAAPETEDAAPPETEDAK